MLNSPHAAVGSMQPLSGLSKVKAWFDPRGSCHPRVEDYFLISLG